MSSNNYKTLQACPMRGQWCSFRLVDEHGNGEPYAHLNYRAFDRYGEAYAGVTDAQGFAKLQDFYCGPLRLDLSHKTSSNTDDWYRDLANRPSFPLPITALQEAAEQTPCGPRKNGETYLARERANQEQATLFIRVEVRDFVLDFDAAHLPDADTTLTHRPSPYLKDACESQVLDRPDERPGIGLAPMAHHVIEVKALRAYSPLFSLSKDFCALNAYHLAVMATFSYAPFHVKNQKDQPPTPPPYKNPGSIGTVLQSELACLIRSSRFNDAEPYHLIYDEVPYSKRLEVVPYNPARYVEEAKKNWAYPEQVHFLDHTKTDTQAFITHNDNVVLITFRGSQEMADFIRDADARQVPHADETGQVHRGFHDAFLATKRFVQTYLQAFRRKNQQIIIAGHSLGGSIALLAAEWLYREHTQDIQLYTFGAPRTGDRAFVEAASGLTHYRLVNHNDPVPGVPLPGMDAEWKMVLPGTVMLAASVGSPLLAAGLLLGGLLNFKGDPYQHHGTQWHFMPRVEGASSEKHLLWQPGCPAIEDAACARLSGALDLKGDMPSRKSLLAAPFMFGQHSSNTGYARSALANLLRWHASVTLRDGELFSRKELKLVQGQLDDTLDQVQRWKPLTYLQLRASLRTRFQPRLEKLTTLQLHDYYQRGLHEIQDVQHKQSKKLSVASTRLAQQSKRRLTLRDVVGDLVGREDLPQLLEQWTALKDVEHAATLAKVVRAQPSVA